MKDFFVADAAVSLSKTITSEFVALDKQVRDSKGGKPYLCVSLVDRTGKIDGRVWDDAEALAAKFQNGDFVRVTGTVEEYRERPNLKITKLEKISPESVDRTDFQRATARDVEAMWAQLRGAVDSFTDENLKALVFAFLDDPELAPRIKSAPAAKYMHHAWVGGLLEHVVDLLEFCDLAAKHFPLIHRDLLLTGAILHDIGKVYELKWDLAFDYTRQGQLVGHISIATRMLDLKLRSIPGFPKRLHMLVEHMILSHHGAYEFGSPKLPMIPEAVLLHYLDNIEAKMVALREVCQPENGIAPEWVDRVPVLNGPLLNTRVYLAGDGRKAEPPDGVLS
jgi:3'-5' exoribonuclease